MSGTLYICGTPIGNLEDVTLRQLRTLKQVDLIACEDTRQTIKLLNHYDISNKLFSYHEHNIKSKGSVLVNMLLEGKSIALVSDAGMPGISDPGADLIRLCRQSGVAVTTVPGPSAVVSAFVLSGVDSTGFIFSGFFPQDNKEAAKAINLLSVETRATVFYEAPHRLLKTLKFLGESLGENRKAAVVRELTKIHEQVIYATFCELASHFEQNKPKGEIVLVIEGVCQKELDIEKQLAYEELDIIVHMERYTQQGITEKDAMKLVAKDRGVAKRDVYALLLERKR